MRSSQEPPPDTSWMTLETNKGRPTGPVGPPFGAAWRCRACDVQLGVIVHERRGGRFYCSRECRRSDAWWTLARSWRRVHATRTAWERHPVVRHPVPPLD